MRLSRFPYPTYAPRMSWQSSSFGFSRRDRVASFILKSVGQCSFLVLQRMNGLPTSWLCVFLTTSLHIWGISFVLMIWGSGRWEDGCSVVKRMPLSRHQWLIVITGCRMWVLLWKDNNGQRCDPDSHHKTPNCFWFWLSVSFYYTLSSKKYVQAILTIDIKVGMSASTYLKYMNVIVLPVDKLIFIISYYWAVCWWDTQRSQQKPQHSPEMHILFQSRYSCCYRKQFI